MTFCFFTAQYLPPRAAWSAIPELARRCVAGRAPGSHRDQRPAGLPARERDEWGLEIYRLPALPVMGGRFPVLRPFAPAADLWAQGIDFCGHPDPDVHPERLGRPAVPQTGHSSPGHRPFHRLHDARRAGRCAGRWYEHLACGVIRRCRFPFYGVSGDVCRWLKTFGITAAGTLPNAVDPAELTALATAEPVTPWRQKLEVPADGHLIAFVGRLIPEKGALRLAEAVQQLPGCVLAVAGTGPEEEALRALGGPVRVLGALPPPDRSAAPPGGLLLSCPPSTPRVSPPRCWRRRLRLSILCTHTAGSGELLPDENYAVYLEDTRPETLTAGLQTVLRDPDATRTRAAHALENLTARFTWQAVYTALLQVAQMPAQGQKGVKMSKLLIVIPAHNEEDNIVQVVESLTKRYP